ncbi:hypothetical protein BDZ89DRAFT_1083848, partial [Hymenopellis radicata]
SVEWPAVPEEVAFIKHTYSPSSRPTHCTVPAPTEGTFHPTTVLQIRSSLSLPLGKKSYLESKLYQSGA